MRCDHRGPLYVQKAFYPEGPDLPHLYLLHPPGGLVSGDHLDVRVNLGENASVLVTSPGAGRLYGARSDKRLQQQYNRLELKENSSMEWFPMETLVYSGARAETCTHIDLSENSYFIGWDICALGLPTSKAPFLSGSLRQVFEIYQRGRPTLIERLSFSAEDEHFRTSPAGLAGFSTNALFVAGPFTDEHERRRILTSLVKLCADKNTALTPRSNRPPMMGATEQGEWLVVRYLGDSATLAREAFIESWTLVRPSLLKREPCSPRIWHC